MICLAKVAQAASFCPEIRQPRQKGRTILSPERYRPRLPGSGEHGNSCLMRQLSASLRACLETTRGAAARDFGCGQGGEFRASPQRAVRNEPTPATDKRPAARRVFGEKAVWLRPARESFRSCSVVAARSASFVAPRHPAF